MAGTDTGRPRVGVSSCLLGEEVRFNGGHKRFRFLTDELDPYVDWVPYCPEVKIGLGTPREPIRLTADGRLVNRSGTADHTSAMTGLPLPFAVDGYVFKAKSPSCGVRGIPRYRDDGEASGAYGAGLYAERVIAEFPLLAVEDEGRLNDAGLREAFAERVFAAARLRSLLSGAVGAAGSGGVPRPAQAAAAGARSGALPVGRAGGGLGRERGFACVDRCCVRGAVPGRDGGAGHRGRNANALLHAYSRIGRALASPRRSDLVGRIDAYRRGEVPLSVPVALLAHYASGGDLPWLASQTFLAPFPAELRLRHAV